MDAEPSAFDSCVQSASILRGAAKIPPKFISISSDFPQTPKFKFPSVMPEHRFAKGQPEWHFVDQRFQCARRCAGAGKIRMGPSPEVAMPVSTVVSLHSEPQRVPRKTPAIQRDLSRKECIGMRCSRESDPALGAQRYAKRGTISHIPRNRAPLNFEPSPAGVLSDFIVANAEVERILFSGAEIQTLQGESLNEALRFSIPRKPCGPHLDGHPTRIAKATAPARIHQQVSEPPRPTTVRQSQTDKPDLVAAPGRER
jgi:hypothetical protein